MNFVTKLRFIAAVWLGKTVFWLSRLMGKNGTTLPGALALKLSPQLIGYLARQLPKGTVIVTGTNGKTTTANMLAAIFAKTNLNLTFNQAGANLITGVATAFLNSSDWSGSIKTEMAVLEVDEATVSKVAPQVMPHTVIITNFFRDQLDRYGELDKTVWLVKETVLDNLPKAKLILNADDPLVAQIGVGRTNVVYYGVSANEYGTAQSNQAREARHCSFCGYTYVYDFYHYGQLGIYRCPKCGFKRPAPQVLAEEVGLHDLEGISFKVGATDFYLQHQGFYNVYNALAAIAAAENMGIDDQTIKTALQEFKPQAGRMEQFAVGTNRITLSLVKNPTGLNEVIRAMVQGNKQLDLLIAINDNAADGRDISWLWDVDFELLQGRIDHVICAGTRAEDMAVRLKYAGIATDKLAIIKDLNQALASLTERQHSEQGIYVLPTYTALFPLRDALSKLRSKAYAT
ncbi:MAG: MurT ligase domain-containing protein [Peptococcaceae bacterium]|nr:MurT ligase domain-containing protein [Peptococcaceae bacterium]